jgi:hypothetical protein
MGFVAKVLQEGKFRGSFLETDALGIRFGKNFFFPFGKGTEEREAD